MINWNYFPQNSKLPGHLESVINVFISCQDILDSSKSNFKSNEVLKIIEAQMVEIGFEVERSKNGCDKIQVPVLFGQNGKIMKSFDVDAKNLSTKTILEVEAGRAITNYQFLKDLFQACVMIDVSFLIIAMRNLYRKNRDFEKAVLFLETLYASNRIELPLKGVLLIGY